MERFYIAKYQTINPRVICLIADESTHSKLTKRVDEYDHPNKSIGVFSIDNKDLIIFMYPHFVTTTDSKIVEEILNDEEDFIHDDIFKVLIDLLTCRLDSNKDCLDDVINDLAIDIDTIYQ